MLEIIYEVGWEKRIWPLNKTECKDEIHRLEKTLLPDQVVANV